MDGPRFAGLEVRISFTSNLVSRSDICVHLYKVLPGLAIYRIQDPESWIMDPGSPFSWIQEPRFRILDLGS